MRIKIFQLFETYGEFYQPYISRVIEKLKKNKTVEVSVVAFNKHAEVEYFIPGYKKRWFKEKRFNLINSTKFNYLEILCLEQKTAIIHIQQSYLFPKIINLLKLPKKEKT